MINRVFGRGSFTAEGKRSSSGYHDGGLSVGAARGEESGSAGGSAGSATGKRMGSRSEGRRNPKEDTNPKETIGTVVPKDDSAKNAEQTAAEKNTSTGDIAETGYFHEEYRGFPHELRDRYYPLALLGTDPYTRVFKVRRKADEKIRVVKIPRNKESPSEILQKEISVWHAMRHPRILSVHRFEYEPVTFLEMEYAQGVPVRGRTIHSFTEFKKPVSPRLAVKLIKGVAQGVAYLHSQGVRHYHLHMGNILLDGNREPVLTGLARGKNEFGFAVGDSDPAEADAPYLAPEQRYPEKFGTVGMKTDIFQVGVILYELLTGVPPYTGKAAKAAGLVGTGEETLILPSRINPSLEPFDPILSRMLAWEKKDRYRSIMDLLRDLDLLDVSAIL